MTSQAAPAAAARYTHPREPWRTWNSKAEADAHYAKFDAVKAEQDARLAAQSQATKDRLAKEARDKADANAKTYWDPNHGWVTNVGNLLVNGAGAIVGGLGGAALGALAGPAGIVAGGAAGAAAGWNLGDLASDALYSGLSGDPFYTSADQIDAGTIGAGLAGGLVSLGGVLMTPQQAAAQMAAGGAGGAGAAEGAGGSPGLGALADQVLAGNYGGGAGGGGAGNVLSDTWDFFTQNPLGQAAAGAGTTYLADQLFNEGQGTSAIMDFFTGGDSGSGSGSGGGNGIAYGTDLTPQYIIDAQKEALERARTLTNSYADYEGPLTAGAAQNELLAANVAADAVGGTADALNDARDMTTGADARYERREGPSSYGSRDDFFDQASLSGYMNPYLEFVQQDTLDNISRENEAIQAALGDQMIQVGAFGGSRTGVAEAENNRNMRQQMLQYINQSNAEAFENARDQFNRDEDRRFAYSEADRNQFNTDLARRLNVGQALGSLASMDSALTQQEINNLMSTGGVLRGIEQAGYTNDFNAYQDFWNRMLGLNAAENAVALGLQSNVLEPPAPEEDPDRLGQILGVLTAGAGLWNTLAGGRNG